MKLSNIKSIHFTGIKGVAMTALALCADDLNIAVSGSDIEELFVTDAVLEEREIKWKIGFKKRDWIKKPDLVITTGAHGGMQNPEVISAKEEKIPVLTQGKAMSLFSAEKDLIVSCGVGGKTTTTSMIAHILEKANLNPSYAIGVGKIFPLGYAGKYDQEGKHFICEADEYALSPGVDNRPKFSVLNPKVVVATNIEHDHPDIYLGISDTKKAFKEFFEKIPNDGLLIASSDSPILLDVIKKLEVPMQTYGMNKDSDWLISETKYINQSSQFKLKNKKGDSYLISLKVPGKYNMRNAVAAFLVAKHLGIEDKIIIEALATFGGTMRRFEKIGVARSGFLLFDDYAHHPKQIKSVLAAAKTWFPSKKIFAIFQPHTYSRTKVLFNQFTESFTDADGVSIMDIYSSAREKKDSTISSKLLAEEIRKKKSNVYYTGDHKQTIEWLKKQRMNSDHVLLTLGAGDVYFLHKEVIKL